jgi:hypothetical protein
MPPNLRKLFSLHLRLPSLGFLSYRHGDIVCQAQDWADSNATCS